MLRALEAIPNAIRGEPFTEADSPGPELAEEIRRAQDRLPGADDIEASGLAPLDDLEDDISESSEVPSPVLWFPDGVDEESAVRELAGAAGGEYQRLSLLRGVDAFAWYLSFHQRAYQWGIYAPVTGVAAYAVQALSEAGITWQEKINVALRAILAHERFHFAADVGTAQVELAIQRALYLPSRQNVASWPALRLIEEQLATAAQLKAVRYATDRAARCSFQAIRDHSRLMPEGYRDGHRLVARRHDFEGRMLDHAQATWQAATGALPASGLELHHLYPAFRPYELARCPTHVLMDQSRYGLGALPLFLICSVEVSEESTGFLKSMDRLPRYASKKWDKARRLLSQSTSVPGLDFKPWPPGGKDCFSVRVDKTLRAHLRFDPKASRWLADAIGFHGEMGHG
jgi:hypothetical protein